MRYLFGDYSLDTQRYELSRAGVLIPLRPKVFQVLAYLLAQRDRVVLKQELLEHVWPAQYIGDAALNSCIMAVRQALGDSGETQRYIRTVRRRGYRFVAPVEEQEPGLMRGGRPLSTRVIWQSEAYLLAGRVEEAWLLALQGLDLVCTRKERGHEAWMLRLLGELAVQRKPLDAEQAETHFRQALSLAETLGMRPLQAHCHCSLGTLYAKTGQREQARAELSTAIKRYRALQMTFWLPQAEAALAQAAGR